MMKKIYSQEELQKGPPICPYCAESMTRIKRTDGLSKIREIIGANEEDLLLFTEDAKGQTIEVISNGPSRSK